MMQVHCYIYMEGSSEPVTDEVITFVIIYYENIYHIELLWKYYDIVYFINFSSAVIDQRLFHV